MPPSAPLRAAPSTTHHLSIPESKAGFAKTDPISAREQYEYGDREQDRLIPTHQVHVLILGQIAVVTNSQSAREPQLSLVQRQRPAVLFRVPGQHLVEVLPYRVPTPCVELGAGEFGAQDDCFGAYLSMFVAEHLEFVCAVNKSPTPVDITGGERGLGRPNQSFGGGIPGRLRALSTCAHQTETRPRCLDFFLETLGPDVSEHRRESHAGSPPRLGVPRKQVDFLRVRQASARFAVAEPLDRDDLTLCRTRRNGLLGIHVPEQHVLAAVFGGMARRSEERERTGHPAGLFADLAYCPRTPASRQLHSGPSEASSHRRVDHGARLRHGRVRSPCAARRRPRPECQHHSAPEPVRLPHVSAPWTRTLRRLHGAEIAQEA